jgi:hypothetical protein
VQTVRQDLQTEKVNNAKAISHLEAKSLEFQQRFATIENILTEMQRQLSHTVSQEPSVGGPSHLSTIGSLQSTIMEMHALLEERQNQYRTELDNMRSRLDVEERERLTLSNNLQRITDDIVASVVQRFAEKLDAASVDRCARVASMQGSIAEACLQSNSILSQDDLFRPKVDVKPHWMGLDSRSDWRELRVDSEPSSASSSMCTTPRIEEEGRATTNEAVAGLEGNDGESTSSPPQDVERGTRVERGVSQGRLLVPTLKLSNLPRVSPDPLPEKLLTTKTVPADVFVPAPRSCSFVPLPSKTTTEWPPTPNLNDTRKLSPSHFSPRTDLGACFHRVASEPSSLLPSKGRRRSTSPVARTRTPRRRLSPLPAPTLASAPASLAPDRGRAQDQSLVESALVRHGVAKEHSGADVRLQIILKGRCGTSSTFRLEGPRVGGGSSSPSLDCRLVRSISPTQTCNPPVNSSVSKSRGCSTLTTSSSYVAAQPSSSPSTATLVGPCGLSLPSAPSSCTLPSATLAATVPSCSSLPSATPVASAASDATISLCATPRSNLSPGSASVRKIKEGGLEFQHASQSALFHSFPARQGTWVTSPHCTTRSSRTGPRADLPASTSLLRTGTKPRATGRGRQL